MSEAYNDHEPRFDTREPIQTMSEGMRNESGHKMHPQEVPALHSSEVHNGLYQKLFNNDQANNFAKGQLLSYQIEEQTTKDTHKHYCIWIDKYVIFEFKNKSNEAEIRPLSEEFLGELRPEDGEPDSNAHVKCLELTRQQYLKIRMKQFSPVLTDKCECQAMIRELYK